MDEIIFKEQNYLKEQKEPKSEAPKTYKSRELLSHIEGRGEHCYEFK